MGLTLSARRIRFNSYCLLARNLFTPISEIGLLKQAFCGLLGTKLSKLKNLHSDLKNPCPIRPIIEYRIGRNTFQQGNLVRE